MTLMRLITIKYFNRLTALIYIYIVAALGHLKSLCVMCWIVFRYPLCQLFYVHALECSSCQSVWGANHQVSWGRALGEQEGGGLHVEGTGLGVARVTGCC